MKYSIAQTKGMDTMKAKIADHLHFMIPKASACLSIKASFLIFQLCPMC